MTLDLYSWGSIAGHAQRCGRQAFLLFVPAKRQVWEAEAIEHVARWAAEHGQTELEAWCDEALAGAANEHDLLSWASEDGPAGLRIHMERGVNLGWTSRSAVRS